MKRRLISAVVLCAAVAAFAQDGQAPQVASGYTSPRVDFGIVVNDIEKSKAFYEQVLGLKETRNFTAPGEVGTATGLSEGLPFTVHVLQLGDGPDASQVKLLDFQGTRPHRPDNAFLHSTYGIRYLTFYVADLAATLDRLADAGSKPLGEGALALPDSIAPGAGIAVVRDPDGNFIELVGPYKK